jgi:S1-C subfamily serine protease
VKPNATPAAARGNDDPYALEYGPYVSGKSKARRPAHEEPEDVARGDRFVVSTPTLVAVGAIGAAVGVIALLVVSAFLRFGKASDPAGGADVAVVADNPSRQPNFAASRRQPGRGADAGGASVDVPANSAGTAEGRRGNTPQGASDPAQGFGPAESVPTRPSMPTAVAASPVPQPSVPGRAPGSDVSSGMVSAAAAAGLSDEPEPAPEPALDSGLAAQARTAAADVAKSDEGAGKTMSTADIVAESEPAVALIKSNSSGGTGFLIGRGLLATNAHVIADEFMSDVKVSFISADDKHKAPLRAQLLYEDAERDIAFLAVKSELKPLRVAKTYTFRKGEDITIIGSPGFADDVLENAISRGVMSTRTKVENKDFYQLNVSINHGNSGGPVFDSTGRVIGIATLKSVKQEAMGFCIPIEDVQAALAKLAKQSNADAERFRSNHRIKSAVSGLGNGGALMCWIIDFRRAGGVNNPQIKVVLDKLEPIAAEMNKETFPSLSANTSRVKGDPLVAASLKAKIGEMNDNFARIKGAYSGGTGVDDNQLPQWKQTHKRLLTELSTALKLEIPGGIMTAFDDHSRSQPSTVVTIVPNLGSYSSRLRPPLMPRQPGMLGRPPGMLPRPPGMLGRPPGIRDRLGPRTGFR